MKLHLPKLLFVAVVAAASFAQADSYNPDAVLNITGDTGNKKYDVGLYNKVDKGTVNVPKLGEISVGFITSPVLLSDSNNTATYEGDLTLTGKDKLGAFNDNGELVTSFSKYTLSGFSTTIFGYRVSGHKNKTIASVSNNLEVTGTLTIKGEAQVVLGGQVATDQYAEYAGVIADAIVVSGDTKEDGTPVTTNLSTWNANVNSLTVNSGKVEIHTQIQYGNNFFNFGAPKDSKQAQFKRAININGGVTTINDHYNENNLDDASIFATFGEIVFKKGGKDGTVTTDYTQANYAEVYGATITQTAGTLVVEGKTASVGGLNIVQQGGTMSISSDGLNQHSWHILSDYGDSKIEQSGKAGTVLNIGGIGAFNSKYNAVLNKLTQCGVSYDEATGELVSGSEKVDVRPVLELIQSGAGEINIFKGVDFSDHRKDNIEDSSITQTGGGEINLGGEYKGVVFDIMQSGKDIASGSTNISTINVKGDLTADVVNQDRNGSIVVSSGKTLTANSVNAGVLTYEKQIVDGKEVQVVTGGSVEMNGNVSLSDGSISTADKNVTIAGTLAADNITVDNSSTLTNDGFIVVSGGIVLKDGATLTNNGTITGSSTFALMTADEQAAVILSETEDLIILEEGANLINEGSIKKDILVKGGTLTLANSEGSTKNITMESGTIYVTGQGVQTGSLTLNGGTINFADGATVALDENLTYDLSGAEIIVMVDDVNNIEGSTVTLFSGNGAGTVTGLESATFKFQDANAPENVVTGTITDLGSGSIKVEATVAIPEPTTATLSLLALAGLCARRRRR